MQPRPENATLIPKTGPNLSIISFTPTSTPTQPTALRAQSDQGVLGTKSPPIIPLVSPCIRLPIKSSVLASLTRLFLVAIGDLRPPLNDCFAAFLTWPRPLTLALSAPAFVTDCLRPLAVAAEELMEVVRERVELISSGRSSEPELSVRRLLLR